MPHKPLFTDELRAMANATDAHVAYKRYIKRIGDKPMSKPVFMEFWRGLKGLPRSEAKKSPRKTIERGQAWIPLKDALQASVNATPTHEKGVASMATKTKSTTRKGRLVSPFTYDDPDVAYAAYKKMPHTKSPNARVMGKREFMKVFPERHAAAMAKQNADVPAPTKRSSTRSTTQNANTLGTVDTVLGESWQDADQAVIDALLNAGYTMPEVEDEDEPTTDAPDPTIISALAHNTEALNAYLAQFGGSATTTKAQRSNAKRYRARTDRTELPGEGNAYAEDDDVAPASNAVLWALNTEGLLAQAYERAEEAGDVLGTTNAEDTPYITQAVGKGLLTEVFGPLPERTSTSA